MGLEGQSSVPATPSDGSGFSSQNVLSKLEIPSKSVKPWSPFLRFP